MAEKDLGGEKKKKMDKKKIVPIVMAALVAMAALAAFIITPVSAQGDPGCGCIADTKLHDTINGGVYFEQQGWAEFNSMTRTFNNVPSGIKEARIYTGFWEGSPGKGGFFNITIQNATGSYTTDTYKACDPCPQATGCLPWQPQRCDMLNATINMPWNAGLDRVNMHGYTVGCGVQFVSFNATPYIAPGTNDITVKAEACPDCYRGGWDGRIYVIALLVLYEDGSMPATTYWVNEGALYMEKGSDCDGPDDHLYASKYFNGTYVSSPTRARLWSLGWPHVINGTVSPAWTKLNNYNIGTPDITESHGGGYSEVLLRWQNIPTGYLSTSNLLEYYDPDPLYERAFAEVLIVESSNEPDLTVTDIGFPTVMRPNKAYTITATVENQGGASAGLFNVSMAVERGGTTYYSAKKHVSGLTAGAGTSVSFSNVNLAAGCYNFSVVADCDGSVTESNENNNEEEARYQVGNVIVVSGNSGFDALVSDTGLPAGSVTKVDGTYYIQNLDITNCACDGIYIENTDVPFVVTNCDVHDCACNGMRFYNVINGKVTESEVWNNEQKGMRMRNCSSVLIDNNYVHDNLKYGIDVYMDIMPYIDSHHITLTNNRIERNLYGIELFCFDCTVHSNLILNTTSWGGGEEGWGIYVSGNDSRIYNNTIQYSDSYAIKVDNTWIPTYWNCIFGNSIIDNNQLNPHTSQAFDNGDNYWNSTVEIGYYYGGTGSSYAFDNHIGSYWSDFTCVDGNNDGICDGQYNIDEGTNTDNAPPVQKWMDYDRIECGDVNCDGGVTTADVYPTFRRVYGDPVCSDWAADVNCDGGVTTADVYPTFRRVYGDPVNCCEGCA
jgi:hypothetical protein